VIALQNAVVLWYKNGRFQKPGKSSFHAVGMPKGSAEKGSQK
jgi:hypothetical protein